MGQVRGEHRVEGRRSEGPSPRCEGVTRSLRVVHDEGRGLGEDGGERALLRGAELGWINDQGLVGGREDDLGDISSGWAHVAFDEEGDSGVCECPRGDVAVGVG